MSKRHPLLAMGVLTLVQVLFGINFVTSKLVVGAIAPATFASLRFLIAGLVLYVVAAVGHRSLVPDIRGWRTWGLLAALGLLGTALSQSMFLTGLRLSTSTNAAILGTTIPVFTMLIVWVRHQSPMSWREWVGMGVALAALLGFHDIREFSFSDNGVWGDVLILGGSFLMAVQISFSKDLFSRVSLFWGTAMLFLIGGLALLPAALGELIAMHSIPTIPGGGFVGAFAYSVLGATLITYFLNNWSYRHVSPSVISLFIYLQPVVAFAVATRFLGETVSMRKIICGVVIFAGMALSASATLGGSKKIHERDAR